MTADVEAAVASAPSAAGAEVTAGPAPACPPHPALTPEGVSPAAPALASTVPTPDAGAGVAVRGWWTCEHCDDGFLTKKALGQHRAAHHPISRTKPAYTPEPEGRQVVHAHATARRATT
jgi:hypothetical protein